ncbi:DUF692 domain-containing protein [uncultured Cocleimonas sp.]|uniref:MNIO family bufferin maturase n=1 Tax=uncultured Cocleimonas sp. TaxID=1051587 RepID=UPI002634C318|nr:DUF692 domain-containing protein [uncultured Cocleimonas sp.]
MKYPSLGFGLGLRKEHYNSILETSPEVDWFEVLTENYLVEGGKPLYFLDQISERYPVVMHGVSMSIGSSDPIDKNYLSQVKSLAERTNARWISDHLCFTGLDGVNAHDLLPLPYTDETVKFVAEKICQVQDYLGRRILIENVSSYITYKQSEGMTEWEFVSAVAEESDSLMLLDINNIFVSAFNHGFDPLNYLDGVPAERVQQHHIAGHSQYDGYIIDTHDNDVVEGVWDLYAEAVKRFDNVSTMIERDDNIPELSHLMKELQIARNISAANKSAT